MLGEEFFLAFDYTLALLTDIALWERRKIPSGLTLLGNATKQKPPREVFEMIAIILPRLAHISQTLMALR